MEQLHPGSDPQPYRVATNDLDLTFLPTAGGRLLSIRVGHTELLWQNPDYFGPDLSIRRPRSRWQPLDGSMGSWANLGGSKTWPAPQGWDGPGQWAGPPDPVLDSGQWQFEDHWHQDTGELEIQMVSPADPRTGVQITRTYWVPATGTDFRQRNTFRNTTDAAIVWSIWEVCQVDTATGAGLPPDQAGVDIAVREEIEPLVLGHAVGQIAPGTVHAGIRTIAIQPVVAKAGFPGAGGMARYRRPDGAGLTIEFTVDPQAEYPDGGSRIELWMQCPQPAPIASEGGLHPNAHLVELEALAPLTTIAPGACTSMDLTWRITAAR